MEEINKIGDAHKAKYGPDYYAKIGAIGGKTPTSRPKGLAALSPERRREISRLGGMGGKGKRKKRSRRAASDDTR